MNTISFPHKRAAGAGPAPEEDVQESIYPEQHEVNITEGGEFLDDAIRMKDQPLAEQTHQKMNNSRNTPDNGNILY